jgi:cytochrome c oxidase cbb3-type subunit 4
MDTFTMLRSFAGTWALVGLVLCFLTMVAFALRPGASRRQHEAANSIFRNDDRPAPAETPKEPRP